ncbi:MAG TPA: ABC transporter substrate-binding protein [Acidimicrobiales bacterium]|nr:ABC transporter substrate-binding protein [Acidimicrobiales bacterium]
MSFHTRLGRATVTLVLAALVGSACGSSTKSSSTGVSKSTSAGSNASVLGRPNKAAGTPVKVGLISDGKSDTIDDTPEITAAQASTAYTNAYLGGVNGHPIDLLVCQTHQTPAGATDCATQMVNDKVVAVLYGVSGQGGSIFKGLQGSNIPLIALGTIDQDTLIKPGAFALANLVASVIAGPAGIARAKGIKHAAVVVIDVPAASGPVKALGGAFYKNAGVAVDVVTVPPGTADMTPQIQAELAKNPGQFAIVGDQGFCTSALKAIKTLGFTGPIVINPECIDTNTASSIPGGYAGITVATWNTSTDHTTPDYKLYSAVMDAYVNGSPKGGVAPGGYMVVRAFADVMGQTTGDITPAIVTSTFSSMPSPVAFQMGGGTTFQCGTKPVSFVPNVCAAKVLQGVLDAQGNSSNFQVLDTSDLTKLG